jgi:beta-lactamase regulating signal transducer with metallopeptidase domain
MIPSLSFTSCVDRLGWVLVHSLWQFALLTLGALILQRALQRCCAVARYWALLVMMCAVVSAPVATWCWLPTDPPAVTSPVVANQIDTVVPPLAPVAADREPWKTPPIVSPPSELTIPRVEVETPEIAQTAEAPWFGVGWARIRDTLHPWLSAIVWAWCLGVVAFATRPLVGWYTVRRLRMVGVSPVPTTVRSVLEGVSQRLGLRRATNILQSTLVQVPVVVGYFRPVILVPMSVISGLPASQLEAILAHELAHIRRHDYLVNLLQTLLETVFFYHPAVWWLSRQIRNERENCCDDLAVVMVGSGVDYGRALLAVAELHRTSTALVLGVRGGSLLARVRRILGGEPSQHVVGGGMLVGLGLIAAAVLVVLSALAPAGDAPSSATEGSVASEESRDPDEPSWGQVSNGLRARILAVAPDTDEQKPDWAAAKRQSTLLRAEDLTLLVELQNASDKPLWLQGTRYGDSYAPPTRGKSASDHFAPLLFDCEFFDGQGRPVEGPSHRMLDSDAMMTLSGGLAETLKPTESLVVLLRPGKWDPSLAGSLAAGEYRVHVRYHGPGDSVLQKLRKTWPDKPVGSVWTGDVSSGEVSFRIAGEPEGKRPELVWGEAVNGLRAAVEFCSGADTAHGRLDEARHEFPHGSRLSVYLHVRNVSEQAISFCSETWRQDDIVMLVDESGEETRLGRPWYSGWANVERWTLQPGQTAILQAIAFGIAADRESAEKLDDPIGSKIIGPPGKYRLRYELRFNTWKREDENGRPVPGEGDWQGALSTGITTISVRERRPEDEPPTFTARLRFDSPDGKPVEAGQIKVQTQSRGRPLLETEVTTGPVEVPDCPFENLTVYVQAPGFEETRFYDVAVKPNQVTVLTLPRAEPVRFRLVTRDGKPVVGAKVRHFNRTKMEASAGPYPTAGLNGPVWATSNAEGQVVLDMLQKADPLDRKLGNNIYWFYVDPPSLAPLFLGPLQAGEDHGNVVVGPLLEARGEVRGTPEELAAFSAEWDQPEPMKRGNGEIGWYYAESKRLETRRDGDKLTFRLRDLRPGKLRIVSRFKKGGKSISHVFSRREPNEDDVVFEVELTESRDDLVIANQCQPSEAAWGPASPKGIRLGVAMEPAKAVYKLGEVVQVKLRLENSAQREQSFAVPNIGIIEKFGMDIDLRDSQGQKLPWNWGGGYSEEVKGVVCGAIGIRLPPGESWQLAEAALLLGNGTPNDGVARLDVKPGQAVRLKLKLKTYGYARDDEASPLESDTIEFRVEAAEDDPLDAADASGDQLEARREALRVEIEQAVKRGDQAAAGRHLGELISLRAPPLRDCRQAIQHFQQRQDWSSLATAYEVTAKVMQAIIVAPPERFTRPVPPAPAESRRGGPLIEVQTELDGVWQPAKGPADGWFDWIRRKQRDMKGERFKVLCQLATLYHNRLQTPDKAAAVLRESLADVPFFTIPLEELIADQWPAKEREISLSIELGIRRSAATDLVDVLEQLGQLDTAVDMQSRVVLAAYSWGGLPYRDIEKLWTLLKKRPAESPVPRLAWINLLSPDRPSIEFDLDSFSAPRADHKLAQLAIAPRPGLEFDSLELTVDMESQGGYVGVWCSTLRDGTHAHLGDVKWHQDQRKGRESRTAKFSIPAGTGVVYFKRSWLADTAPDGVTIHRIAVKATFRPEPTADTR